MTEKQRKTRYWALKISSIIVSCLFPLYAIWEHFPIWVEESGSARSLGSGVIIAALVVFVVFKNTVVDYIKEKFKGRGVPPMTIWIVLLVIVYILIYINKFLIDLTVVLWMGLIGCTIGTVLTYIAEHKYGKKDEVNNVGA